MNRVAITINTNVNKFIPSIEFSVWERKFLLRIIDSLILITGLFLYYKIDNPDLSAHHILFNNYIGFTYGLTLFLVLSTIFDLYNLEILNTAQKVLPLVFFVGIVFSFIFILTPIITPPLPGQRKIIVGFVFYLSVALALWRIFYIYVIHIPAFFKNVIVLVSDDYSDAFLSDMKNKIEANGNHGYRLRRVYSIPKRTDDKDAFERTFDKIVTAKLFDTIILLDKDNENISVGLNKLLIKAIQNGIDVQTYFKLYEELKEAIPLNLVGSQFYNIFPISRSNSNYFYKLWYRAIDVLLALFGLSIMLALIPVIALINLFVNRGPLFYSQLRVGKGGKEYELIKFRSMDDNAESQDAIMATKNDARITGFGKILRKTHIDELPQFLAVLNGDMSLIGPRPERKVFVDQLSSSIPFYNARHLIRPGITGWAQVKYPYGENLEDSYNKLEYDLYYIKNRSITLDLRIIVKTINTVIFSKGL